MTNVNLASCSSQAWWPRGEPGATAQPPNPDRTGIQLPAGQRWRDAVRADRATTDGAAHCAPVPGLGLSGRVMLLMLQVPRPSGSQGRPTRRRSNTGSEALAAMPKRSWISW